jgi:hypothetical protein
MWFSLLAIDLPVGFFFPFWAEAGCQNDGNVKKYFSPTEGMTWNC